MTNRYTRRKFLIAGTASVGGISTVAGCSSSSDGTVNSSISENDFIEGDGSLLITHDVVLGQAGVVRADQAICQLQSRFARGQQVVWRIKVTNSYTGKFLSNKQLDGVDVVTDEETFDAFYKGHPFDGSPTDWYWVVSWVIPDDYPAGPVGYSIRATGNGRQHQQKTVRPTSKVTVLDETATRPEESGGK